MPKRRYLRLIESDLEPRQGLARFYKFIGRRFGLKVVDHCELPAGDSKERLADLVKPATGTPAEPKTR